MVLNYKNPAGGTKSSIDSATSDQMNTFMWLKASIIEAQKEQYFLQLASTIGMPKNFGKTIKLYEYVPLLDDRNVNDQGINASGVTISNGNLYGSSKDIGNITSKLPVLGENGGRVNRVGFTRVELEGTFHKFGMFYEFSQEALDFDSDADLAKHLARELMTGASQITEAVLQKDLLAASGVILYSGAATSNATITGEETTVGGATVPASVVTYDDFVRLDQILTENRTPKHTKVVTGSLMQDTKTIPACRVCYVGSELMPLLKRMKDPFGNPAFIPVQQYGRATSILRGEEGTIANFRIIQVPEMLHWAGVGAVVDENPGFRTSTVGADERYDVYPILFVGEDSFTTIGFQTDGKTVKFNVLTKMPGKETADKTDPYGEQGFSSIKWWYGILVKRSERIGLIKTVAPL